MFIELDFEVDNYWIEVSAEVFNIYHHNATFEYDSECGYNVDVTSYRVYEICLSGDDGWETVEVDDEKVKQEIWDKYIEDELDKQIWEQLEDGR